jgi:hypothetical protein
MSNNDSHTSEPRTTLIISFSQRLLGVAILGSRHCCPAVVDAPTTSQSTWRCAFDSNLKIVEGLFTQTARTTNPLFLTLWRRILINAPPTKQLLNCKCKNPQASTVKLVKWPTSFPKRPCWWEYQPSSFVTSRFAQITLCHIRLGKQLWFQEHG